MEITVVNLQEKFSKFNEYHAYKVIAAMNDYYFKAVKCQREFIWHSHPETDEVFIVHKGTLQIDLREKTLTLHPGEMAVIPKGVEHKPHCSEECELILVEPTGTVNTGNAGGELTDNHLEWI